MPPPTGPIDRDKLRAAIHRQPPEYHLYLLDDALELLTPAQLEQVAGKYIELAPLRAEGGVGQPAALLAQVQAFERASLAGEYYEDFRVDSHNCTAKSTGTSAFISDFHRHLDRCVAAAAGSQAGAERAEVCQAFEVLFGLLDEIDKWEKDIVFFADEGGAWQVNVRWEAVLPAWFGPLSQTADAEVYAARVVWMLERHCAYAAAKLLAEAAQAGTPAQRQALERAAAGRGLGR